METGHRAAIPQRRRAWTVNDEARLYRALRTFWVPDQSSTIHRLCQTIVRSSWLNIISVFITLMSCLFEINCSFCVDDNPDIKMWINGGVLVYLTIEMLMKIVALGLYGYEGSYLRSNWNRFDMVIYFALILNIILDGCKVHLPVSEPLKLFLLISKLPNMRMMVFRLSGILSMLCNTFCLLMFFIHIFAVLGVQLWAGALHNHCFLGEDVLTMYNMSLTPYYQSANGGTFICSPDTSNGMQRCSDVPPHRENGKVCKRVPPHHRQTSPVDLHDNASDCMNWNTFYNVCRADGPNPNGGSTNFDNIGYAWITVFQVVTLEGWTDIMHIVMDTYSFWSFLFFLPLTFVGSFIIMNMCAVVIAMCFVNIRPKNSEAQGAEAVTLKALQFISRLKMYLSRSHSRVASESSQSKNNVCQFWQRFLRRVEALVKGELFCRVFMFAIFANIITMALEHHNQPQTMTQTLMVCNIIFVIVFAVEMVLKILGLQWMYFMDQSNLFDFVIVIIGFWELVTGAEGKLSVLRALRVLRFLRLIGFFPTLSRQLLVLVRTIKEASTLCFVLVFFIVIFSFLGMHLFGCTSEPQSKDIAIREDFDSLLWSMVTVFQIMTEENWNLVLYKAIASTSSWAALYFVAVILFGRYVLLNILVGIVVESFHDQGPPQTEESKSDTNRVDGAELHREDNAVLTNAVQLHRSLNCIPRVQQWFNGREDWCLFLLSPQNRWRVFCKNVISHKAFDVAVLSCILMSCITMAVERPSIQPGSTSSDTWTRGDYLESTKERLILDVACYAFTVIFSLEMLLKVTAMGLVFGKDSYCQSTWNIIDGLVVVVSLIDIIIQVLTSTKIHSLVVFKVLRLLRILRPFRMISKFPRLKLALEALIASVKVMGNILFISFFFFFIYGIVGVQLFQGKFYHCVGQNLEDIVNKSDCLSAKCQWVQKPYHFDNLLQALLTLFVMYSMDGWVNIMSDGLNAVGVDQQPVKRYNPWVLIYFISFMIVSFILLDMFIGAMVETFHDCQKKQKLSTVTVAEPTSEALPEQENVAEELSPTRSCLHKFCKSRALDFVITTVIMINVLIMALEHHNQPEYMDKVTEYFFLIFTIILTAELLLKIAAFGLKRFTESRWNLLDVVIVLVSILSIVLTEMELEHVVPFNPGILRVCRVLRLSQVLKAKNIQVLLCTLVKTLSQVGNIGLLFIFFFFIYAVLGVELFGELECSVDYPCRGLNRYSNFQNFGMALITLYKVCTGDDWNTLLIDTLRDCPPGSSDCSSQLHWLAAVFFASFTIIAQFVLANLVVAVIMQALEDSTEEREEQDSQLPGSSAV